MFQRFLLICSISLLALSGCSKRGADPATLKLMQAAGDRATLTVVIQPTRWNKAAATLRPLLQGVPEPVLSELLAAKDLYAALRASARAVKPIELPPKLEGWDDKRPIVLALFEPQIGDMVLATRSLLPMSFRQILETGLPGIRHRVLVPAINAKTLADGLARIFDSFGYKPLVSEAKDPDLKGGTLFRLKDARGFVAFIPEKKLVRIEILTKEVLSLSQNSDPGASWSKLLAEPIRQKSAPVDSPAFHLAASGKHLISAHVRPWLLRDLGSQMGTLMVIEALMHVSAEYKMQLLAAGLAEVANGYLLMSPEGAETEDLAVAWDLDGGLRVTYVAGLTKHGEKIYRAGLASGKTPLGPAVKEAVAHAWSRLDFAAMLQTAGTLPALSQARKPREMARMVQECGYFCTMHFLLRSPFGAARTAMDFVPADLSGKLPRAFSFAITKVNFDNRKAPFSAAVSARFPGGFNTRILRIGLEGLERELGLDQRFDLRTESVDGDEVVWLGLGADPRAVLTKPVKAPRARLGEGTIDLGRLVAELARRKALKRESPEVFKVLERLGSWRMRSHLVDRALVGESLLSLSGAKPMGWTDPASFGGRSWKSQAPSASISKGEACLQQVTREMMKAFKALAMAAPEQRNLLFARATLELESPLACAVAEADTSERAKRTRLVLAMFAADRFADGFDQQAELAVLNKTCKQGHAEACQRAKRIGGRAQVQLPKSELDCGQALEWGQPVGRVRSAEDAGKLLDQKDLFAEFQPEPGLAIDRDAPWSVSFAAMQELHKKQIDRPRLVVRDKHGGISTFQLAMPGAKPKPAQDSSRYKLLETPDEFGPRSDGPMVVHVYKDQIGLLANGSATSFLNTKECRPDKACGDLTAFGKEFDRLAKLFSKDLKIYLQADEQVAFKEVAAVAGRMACKKSGQRWGRPEFRDITVGPVPKEIKDKAMLERVVNDSEHRNASGILSILGSGGGGRVEDVFGSGGLGMDDALGGLSGVGTAGGGGQLGIGTIGTGGLGRGKGKKPVRIRSGKPTVMGSMPKEIIQRIIRRSMGQYKYCYEKELVKQPSLAGKLNVKFVIDKLGAVKTATIKSSTMNNKKVEDCVSKVTRRLRFPSTSGGIVIVNYPFVFKSADLAPKAEHTPEKKGKAKIKN